MNRLLNGLLNNVTCYCTVIAAQNEMVCVYKNSDNVINCFNPKQNNCYYVFVNLLHKLFLYIAHQN